MNRVEPGDTAALCEVMRCCGTEQKKVDLGGRFSKRTMGGAMAPAAVSISTTKLARVIEYEPRDLTVSVEAGVGFQALEDLLAANNQMLPLDPPAADVATVGGVVASSCSGPRRRLYGSARDMVIGMRFVTLEGKEVRSGGMVVKNVAGLDMAKLLIGSFGTLAAIARVNFRVYPRPPRQQTFVLAFEQIENAIKARDAILRSVLQPAAVDLANPAAAARLQLGLPSGYVLMIDVGGIEAVMARYERELKAVARDTGAADFSALDSDAAQRLWSEVRDFPALPGDQAGAVIRLSTTLARLGECFTVAGNLPVLARAGSGIVYVHAPPAGVDLASRARAAGLYAVIESCSAENKDQLDLWAEPGPELQVMSRIKQSLDPHNLLNHGRLYNRL